MTIRISITINHMSHNFWLDSAANPGGLLGPHDVSRLAQVQVPYMTYHIFY